MKSTLSLQGYKDLKEKLLKEIELYCYTDERTVIAFRNTEPLYEGYYPIVNYCLPSDIMSMYGDLDRDYGKPGLITKEQLDLIFKNTQEMKIGELLKELTDTIKYLEFREVRSISKKTIMNGFAYEATPTSPGAIVFAYKGIAKLGSGSYKEYSEDTAFITYTYLGRNGSDFDYNKAMEGLILTIESMAKEDGYKKIYALTGEDDHVLYENLGYIVTDKIDKEKCDKLCGARIMNAVYVEKQIA